MPVILAGSYLLILCPDVMAVEESVDARDIWDLIMRLFNFGVIAFVAVKYGRKPLMNFLHSYSNSIQDELQAVETKHKDAKSKMEDAKQKLDSIGPHLQEIRERLLEIGEKEKDRYISQAKQRADQMIEEAKLMSEQERVNARQYLHAEMVDFAVSLAEERIKERMTPEENQVLLNNFVSQIHQKV